jgi:hypothetical protein
MRRHIWFRIAAAAGLLVIGSLVVSRSLFTTASPFANIGTATSPPRFYVEIDPNDNIVVQSTATGRRTDVVAPLIQGNTNADAALAVSADGRRYVAAYNDWATLRTSLFRFTVSSAGQVAGFSLIRTRRLPGLTELSVAISPDGTQLALAGIPDKSRSVEASSGPPHLLVVNLRTGEIRTWHGLARSGATDSIEDPMWATSGSLRFLVMTCHAFRAFPLNATCEGRSARDTRWPVSAEWTLTVRHSSAALGSGQVLVRLPGATVQALSGPGDSSVVALQLLHSGGIRVAGYDVPRGRLLQTLYAGKGDWKSNWSYAGLAADGSGKYLLVDEDVGAFFGWIGNGQFHKLPINAPHGNDEAVAASW